MKIVTLHGYNADIELGGRVHRVRYDDDDGGALRIEGISFSEAKELIEHAALGRVEMEDGDLPLDKVGPRPARLAPCRCDIVDETPAAPPSSPTPTEAATAPASEPSASAPATDGTVTLDDELLGALRKCSKLKDVLVLLEEKGIAKGLDGLLSVVSQLRDEVPMLKRIVNLDDRVRAAYTVLESAAGG